MNIKQRLEYYQNHNQKKLNRIAIVLDISIMATGLLGLYLIINNI